MVLLWIAIPAALAILSHALVGDARAVRLAHGISLAEALPLWAYGVMAYVALFPMWLIEGERAGAK